MLNEAERRVREQTIYTAVLGQMEQGADLSALTVSQIAAAAGMGKGTVYEYFSSKQEILAGLSRYCCEQEIARLNTALTPCTALQPAIQVLCDYLQDVANHRSATYHVLAQMIQRNHELLPAETIREISNQLADVLGSLFDRLRQNGELAPNLSESYCFNAAVSACVACMLRLAPCCLAAQPPDAAARQALAAQTVDDTATLLQRAFAP